MSAKNKFVRIALPLIILIVGFVGMRTLINSRQAPQKTTPEHPGVLAEVIAVESRERQIRVSATGTVQARQEASITPQVSGRVTGLSPDFVAGGFFRKGDLLFDIEAVDYQLAVDRAQAALAKTEYDLATVESQARVARQEWDRLTLEDKGEPPPLALYEPQMKNAQAAVDAARAALEQSRLDLKRTRVYAPFNCRVRSEQADLGQYVRAGEGVAVIAGTDSAEVVVPLPLEELQWLNIPGPGSGQAGSPARVRMNVGGSTSDWEGRVVRSLGEVDARGRMARVVVAVTDPYGMEETAMPGRPALAVGMFVDVTLEGETLPSVIALPRRALHEGSTVWVADDKNLLRFRTVEVLRLEQDEVLIAGGLENGARVVLTVLPGAADGMRVRPLDAGAAQ
ncbi:MAG: efflux RND transporter periplasmic adaptor subunit [Desulfuromonas sp.]|uniref:efflux RND transporter periplasmic adaptor subunit n=1 Tax=Desulfuromonas sp. TaxID=892 RepID=UPI000CB9C192|nr:efflux RND transporter periplasmic adaptor subunit [Desulfuromonas sp.]PLX85495.1 MAG: efflux RND transporter periplasmic adaptor subunit [Desulfuromonas sp.]